MAFRNMQGEATPELFPHGQRQLHTSVYVAQRQMYALQTHFQQSHIHSEPLVPVHRLPPHLLVRIFNHLSVIDYHQLDDPPSLNDFSLSFDRTLLFNAMLVCRRWHDVAVNFAPFWTHIDLDVVQHPNTFIQRSLGFPPSFHFSINKPNMNSKLSFLEQCGPLRVRSLYINCDSSPPISNEIAPPPGWRAPEVESLAIVLQRGATGADRLAQWFVQSIPKAGLKGLAIRVSDNHLVTWPTEPLPRLTHLFLELSHEYEDHPDGVIANLLKLLTRAPLLEHIYLSLSPLLTLRADPDLPVVALDHARSITLHLSFLSALSILHHLSLPPHVFLCMSHLLFDSDSDDEDAEPPDLDPLRFPPLSLFRDLTFMELSIHDDQFNCSANNAQKTAGYLLIASNLYHWHLWVEVALPLTQIRVLHLNLDDVVSIERLPQIIANFISLEELFVVSWEGDMYGEETTIPLLNTLTETLAQTSPVVCAELRVFGLESDILFNEFPFDKLAHMLEARIRAGCPLTRFVYQCRDQKFDHELMHEHFEDAIPALNVETAEYLPDENKRLCPFRPNECWDFFEAEKYWLFPKEQDWVFMPQWHKGLSFDMPWGEYTL